MAMPSPGNSVLSCSSRTALSFSSTLPYLARAGVLGSLGGVMPVCFSMTSRMSCRHRTSDKNALEQAHPRVFSQRTQSAVLAQASSLANSEGSQILAAYKVLDEVVTDNDGGRTLPKMS